MNYFRGIAGQFTVSRTDGPVTAKYILTRMRAASDGSWPAVLTSNMRPWREVFEIQKMTFDELVQRDLDDSRVANELIPYVLGRTTSRFPVFPPILAVLVQTKPGGIGIEPHYPKSDDGKTFGDLFSVKGIADSDLVECQYNPHQTGFVIVDGQHRAMAVLALFRQAQGPRAWGSSPYRSYYDHLTPTPAQLVDIELPVCVLYFPQLHAGNLSHVTDTSDLTRVCRQIFLDVNKEAKPVSKSREILLDDTDFAAILMRRALASLKDRVETLDSAKVAAFDYGRGEATEYDRIGALSDTEYSSVEAIYSIAGALSFGRPDAMKISSTVDISDGRNRRNPERPAVLLRGLDDTLKRVSVSHASTVGAKMRELIANNLASLWEPVIPNMFNSLRPYRVHNRALAQLKAQLSRPESEAIPALAKTKSLLFDGSGGRSVFNLHMKRLKEYLTEYEYLDGQTLDEFRTKETIQQNVAFCNTVESAIFNQTHEFKKSRALTWWDLPDRYFDDKTDDPKAQALISRADRVFRTFATQALQVGYAMTVASLLDYIVGDEDASFVENKSIVNWAVTILDSAINFYLSPEPKVEGKNRKPYHKDSRANAFDPAGGGLRSYINLVRGPSLDNKAWPLFRWVFIEILFSPKCQPAIQQALLSSDPKISQLFVRVLPQVYEDLESLRSDLSESAVTRSLKSPDLAQGIVVLEAEARAEKLSDEEIQNKKKERLDEEEEKCRKLLKQYRTDSVGKAMSLSDLEGFWGRTTD